MSDKPTKKRPRDPVQRAKQVFDEAIGEAEREAPLNEKSRRARNIARMGGAKGGPARAAKLTPDQRTEIAKIAANARWKKAAAKEP